MNTVESVPQRSKYGPKLTEAQKRAIVAEVASGRKQVDVAQQFGVHPQTVKTLVKSIKDIPNTALNPGWRQQLYETMVPKSVDAIERSINDLHDVHKAAGTAMAHLKAVGVVKDESNVTTNIFVNVQDLPNDWYQRMRPVNPEDRAVIDVTPEESKG